MFLTKWKVSVYRLRHRNRTVPNVEKLSLGSWFPSLWGCVPITVGRGWNPVVYVDNSESEPTAPALKASVLTTAHLEFVVSNFGQLWTEWNLHKFMTFIYTFYFIFIIFICIYLFVFIYYTFYT